ncbi:unnamed protein product [Arctia plantaginis]|uniref:Kazal-like domain-containing protein n=1 Tax=Arctia plantaginis TaxID=874455 RepID=A0A8S1A183_ARCPL|nr:unnamed protein product [Arctia plantaginis]
MYYRMVLLMPVLLPTLVIKTACDNDTDGDVIVRYAGHAEADENRDQKIFVENKPLEAVTDGKALETKTEPSVATVHESRHLSTPSTESTTPIEYMDETEGVVFVPNDAPTVRLEDEYARDGLGIHEVIGKKTVYDVMDGGVHVETESPHDHVIFVPGSNNDNVDPKEKEERSGRRNTDKVKEEKRVVYPQYKLDCSNLDCNNSMKSICGGKIVNGKLQYRLFLNDCYFRKVNCNFKYKLNRYTIVPLDKCIKYGARGERPFTFSRRIMDTPTKPKEDIALPKSFSSRRSMSMNVYGNFCSHPCPVTCPDDYEPQCAISATGQRRVFMNHCKLDDNSCLFSVVWHMRPLSECVGGKKADMRQNRYFIGWMRQVGILDNKGKLVLQ